MLVLALQFGGMHVCSQGAEMLVLALWLGGMHVLTRSRDACLSLRFGRMHVWLCTYTSW